MRRTILALAVVAIALVAYLQRSAAPRPASRENAENFGVPVATAFLNHASGVEVQGTGTVAAILPDDSEGSRHQRFLLRLDSGTTVLIAHNIDLAPRVSPLRTGDRISFRGEYVWNPKGGLVHWTHRDAAGSHKPGWLERDGETFQ